MKQYLMQAGLDEEPANIIASAKAQYFDGVELTAEKVQQAEDIIQQCKPQVEAAKQAMIDDGYEFG
ncbi:MAG: hypothetical protein QF741_02195 [Candidatus Peribacteraceae bacterium]|nr:hypothetical protein [Candidatus Peribacteraceae bacterium]